MVSVKNIFHSSSTTGKQQNPYADPHHPNRSGNPTSTVSPISNTAPRLPNVSVSTLALDPVSPVSPVSSRRSHDSIAETREAGGRDARMGRRVYPPSESAESTQSAYQDHDTRMQHPEEPSDVSGNRYDIITAQMKRAYEAQKYQDARQVQLQRYMPTNDNTAQRSQADEDAISPVYPPHFPGAQCVSQDEDDEAKEEKKEKEKEEMEEAFTAYQRTATLTKHSGTRYDLFVQSLQSHRPTPTSPSSSPNTSALSPAHTTTTNQQTSAYRSRVSGTKRYDAFVAQMQERRAEAKRRADAFVEPAGGYYAPVPVVGIEYYTPVEKMG
ncbi:hypothetical protein K491DRAFT_713272 [Lophiostoma macrostomum CBS 122681]|uniref:Uncharacterized protein n=1 Tax=Lophiostoma macrostomum CBS 122681 TaxID=1314788 RepID=A0A6A6TH83_9PLEO|nr:hypothetical protein K491DRAFT_713272 [Lophiostoma macrostomum CBS 122681]